MGAVSKAHLTNGAQEDHQTVTLRTAPNIDDLCDGQLGHRTDDAGQDGGRRNEGVLVKSTGDVGGKAARDLLLERVYVEDQEDPDGRKSQPDAPTGAVSFRMTMQDGA